jgi:hypothetical protein
VDVQDGFNLNATPLVVTGSADSGDNLNWVFAVPPPANFVWTGTASPSAARSPTVGRSPSRATRP